MSEEHTFKILVLGTYGVGKTSLIHNLTNSQPIEGAGLTYGVRFSDYHVLIGIHRVKFQFWEFVGKREYEFMYTELFSAADGAFIIFDLSRPETFESVGRYIHKIEKHVDVEIPIAVIGNKLDLVEDDVLIVDRPRSIEFVEQHGGIYVESSKNNAKELCNVLNQMYASMSMVIGA